jgi:preprotein translocase subunit SecY
MRFMNILAMLGKVVPSAPKPVKKVPLGRRIIYTILAAIAYIMLASTPLYGIELGRQGAFGASPLLSIMLAMQSGTFAQLGIGPIVTAGLILQILAGAKLIDVDFNDPEDRAQFTLATKGLAIILAVVEATGFVVSGTYWTIPQAVPLWIKVAVVIQLTWGALVLIMLDEAIQKGWGLGSGVSLFILLGVSWRFFGDLLTTEKVGNVTFGLIPYIIDSISTGQFNFWDVFIGRLRGGYPTIVGLIVTIALMLIIAYLTVARINIPIVISRYGGLKTKVPLQLLYVSNIPVLLTGIVISDILLFLNLLQGYIGANTVLTIRAYLSPPTIFSFIDRPWQALVYIVMFLAMCVLFGILWVEIAGLNPEAQAENLINAGLEIPGMRKNPRALASYLARYIYPLTAFSSLVVAIIALVGDLFGSFGTGVGILLAVGILYNYYQILVYEQAIEAYPLLRRLVGE